MQVYIYIYISKEISKLISECTKHPMNCNIPSLFRFEGQVSEFHQIPYEQMLPKKSNVNHKNFKKRQSKQTKSFLFSCYT